MFERGNEAISQRDIKFTINIHEGDICFLKGLSLQTAEPTI